MSNVTLNPINKLDWSDNTKGFLSHFPGNQIFVSMKERDGPPWHYHSEYDAVEEKLKNDNDHERAIFFTVNELDRSLEPDRHRTSKMCTRARALFLDDDKEREEYRVDFPLEPSLVVNSSPGKYHYYWLTSTTELDDWLAVQAGVSAKGDTAVKDLSRYLRLPGYKHLKDKANPFVSVWMGSGKVYGWEELKEKFPPLMRTKQTRADNNSLVAGVPLDDRIADIQSGNNIHDNLRDIAWQYVQDGSLADRYIITMLKGFMDGCSDEVKNDPTNRWQSRYDDIPRTVEDAKKKDFELTSPPERDSNSKEIPWPPGHLGDLCKQAYEMQHYQYKEIAFVSAVGLIAGIVGRKFNISQTGLNIYMTFIMDTGGGKSAIGKFITHALIASNDNGNPWSFKGPKRFTSPAAIIRSLKDARSQVCVLTEAGLLLQSAAGDQVGIGRVILDLYDKSGRYEMTDREEYSAEDNSLPALRGVALTVVSEATPQTLLSALKKMGAIDSGHLPRQSVYRVADGLSSINREVRQSVDSQHLDRIKVLASKCAQVQIEEDSKAWEISYGDLEQEVFDYADYISGLRMECKSTDPIKYKMLSRMHMKALKFAAIATIYNYDNKVVLQRREWEWAKQICQYEIDGLENFFHGGGFGDVLGDAIKNIVAPMIVKIYSKGYSNGTISKHLSNNDRKSKVVPRVMLNQIFKNNAEINALNDPVHNRSSPKKGMDKIVDYMIAEGYLLVIKSRKRQYQITEMFNAIFE